MNDQSWQSRPTSRRSLIGRGGILIAAFLVGCGRGRTQSTTEPAAVPQTPTGPSNDQVITPPSTVISATEPPTDSVSSSTDPGSKPVVFIDPGHGGVDQGAIGVTNDGQPVYEKDVVLAIAERAATRLRSTGYEVVLSRTSDTLPGLQPSDLTADGAALTPQGVLNDLQRRIDLANSSGAQVFLSVHLNANDDPSVRGTSTYYDSTRAFGSDNLRFAQLVQQDLISAFRSDGYTTPDLGVLDDTGLSGNSLGVLPATYNHLALLGPAVPGQLRPTQMPGALNEALFLSNPAEATVADDPVMQDLIAGAYAEAVVHFFSVSS